MSSNRIKAVTCSTCNCDLEHYIDRDGSIVIDPDGDHGCRYFNPVITIDVHTDYTISVVDRERDGMK